MYFSVKLYPARIIFALLTVICMIGIFMFSMDKSDDSSDKSNSITETAVEVFVKDYDSYSPAKQHDIFNEADHIIRKLAHFTIFCTLGFLASSTVGKRRLFSKGSLFTLIFCFIYACSDELHQYFVPGRACRFTDVLIDTGGSITGMILSLAVIALFTKVTKNRTKKAPD